MNTTGRGKRSLVVSGLLSLMVLVFTAGLSWDHIQFWWLFESMGNNAQGRAEYRHRQTGIVFVGLPGGTFEMGSPESERDRVFEEYLKLYGARGRKNAQDRAFAEQPLHEVKLSSFLIAKYEISQAEWKQIRGSNPSRFKGDDLPVDTLSWDDCQEFCKETGLTFPSEAQWEYACRAGTSTAFSFGDSLGTTAANYNGAQETPAGIFRRTTLPVDSLGANGFGIHNMHGNVYEWCLDTYDEKFYAKPEAAEPDPVNRSGSAHRVTRGGSWSFTATACRSAYRTDSDPNKPVRDCGFRPAYYPLP